MICGGLKQSINPQFKMHSVNGKPFRKQGRIKLVHVFLIKEALSR